MHSAKFTNEKEAEGIRKAILRHGLKHPVVNDADQKIMRAYRPLNVRGWPALVLVGPDGMYEGTVRGEGNYDKLDEGIAKIVKAHGKSIDRVPRAWKLEEEKESGPLLFPGKICATADRLYVSDTNHHRILVASHDGAVQAVIGSGKKGRADGAFEKAEFNQPQGLAAAGDALYVADTENHLIRRVDLKARRVETVAGTGAQAYSKGGPALKAALNSPWDVAVDRKRVYIANAGSHQIFLLHLETDRLEPYAGDGSERLRDGSLSASSFNQPSGLAILDGKLYVADSEISGVRSVPLDGRGNTATLVGTGLFDFGDTDGVGDAARLQHVLHVTAAGGRLYVCDAYNHKIKMIDPATRECTTFAGDGKAGLADGKEARFHEPSGLAASGGKLFVADSNNHAIRVIDLASREVATLKIAFSR